MQGEDVPRVARHHAAPRHRRRLALGPGRRLTPGRLLALGAVLVALLATGCEQGGDRQQQPAGQPVEVVAGGGESPSGKAADARIDGRLVDLAVDGGGTVRVLTATPQGLALWTMPVGGTLTRVGVRGVEARDASQLALDPAGHVYLAAGRSVWKVGLDGRAARVVGSDRHPGPSPDGTRADQVAASKITGVAVATDGTLHYSEQLVDPQFLILVRAVRDGRVRTVLGRDPGPTASESEVDAAIGRARDPAPGTRATQLVVGGIQSRLAAGSGGRLYASRDAHGVLALRSDGTVAAVLAGRAPQAIRQPSAPFEPTGQAVDAEPELFLGNSRVSLGADPTHGDLYLVTRVEGTDAADGGPPGPFVWRGSFSPTQKELVARQRANTAVWRVDAQGRLATAAYGADAVAVQGSWVYLAVDLTGDGGDRRVLVLRTSTGR
jgi:hypothetical protein